MLNYIITMAFDFITEGEKIRVRVKRKDHGRVCQDKDENIYSRLSLAHFFFKTIKPHKFRQTYCACLRKSVHACVWVVLRHFANVLK